MMSWSKYLPHDALSTDITAVVWEPDKPTIVIEKHIEKGHVTHVMMKVMGV